MQCWLVRTLESNQTSSDFVMSKRMIARKVTQAWQYLSLMNCSKFTVSLSNRLCARWDAGAPWGSVRIGVAEWVTSQSAHLCWLTFIASRWLITPIVVRYAFVALISHTCNNYKLPTNSNSRFDCCCKICWHIRMKYYRFCKCANIGNASC